MGQKIDYYHFLSEIVFGDASHTWNTLNEICRGELFMQLSLKGGVLCACGVLGEDFIHYLPEIEADYRKEKTKSKILCKELDSFLHELEENQLRFAIFKGADFAYRTYPSPVCRSYCDWDIIFYPDDMKKTLDFLSRTGWKTTSNCGDTPRRHHFPCHTRNGIAMEPHLSFLNLEHVNAYDTWNEMRHVEDSRYQYVLSPELYVIVLCRHAASLGYGHVSLTKFLLDVGYLLKAGPQIDWKHVRELCKRWNVPYAGNLLAAFPEFFPADMIAAMDPDPNAAKAFRKIFEEREKLHGIDQHVWVMNYNQEHGGKSWIAHQMELLRPKQVRAVYGMHAHGQYGALAGNYLRYGAHRAGLLLKNFWRYDSRLRKFDKLVKEAESYR